MSPYQNLANAIVELAAKDYRKALKRLSKYPHDREGLYMKEECERFFRSRWYGLLTGIDPEFLINKLQMEVM